MSGNKPIVSSNEVTKNQKYGPLKALSLFLKDFTFTSPFLPMSSLINLEYFFNTVAIIDSSTDNVCNEIITSQASLNTASLFRIFV